MITVKDGKVLFNGKMSPFFARELLASHGFVHVTGLRYISLHVVDHSISYVGEDLTEEDLGKWDQKNDMTVLVTKGGEVWLKYGELSEAFSSIRELLCPKGRGAFVPFASGERLFPLDILKRASNPYHGIEVTEEAHQEL